jgi:hypothetical protein
MDYTESAIGLCATCRHQRTISGARSTFSLCERSFTDPRFLKYPALPVVRCPGYEPRPAAAADPGKKR